MGTVKKVGIGVVGGQMGASFQWHLHPGAAVTAVADLNAASRQRLKETCGCDNVYDSLEELVKDKTVDAVALFTEAPAHVDHTIEAMKHGKHVICAVPAFAGPIDEAERLLDAVKTYGLTYMMAETSYYQDLTISARKLYEGGKFGELYYCESEYQHDGLDAYFFQDGKPTWRHGMAPMHYPTHCTAHVVGVTGERLTEVTCVGWGDGDPILKTNQYGNPFWNETALFKTDRGHAFRVNIWWKGAHMGCERAQWIGTDMSLYAAHPNGIGAVMIRRSEQQEKDDGGFVRNVPKLEEYDLPEWWQTDMLPEPLRLASGHGGSHVFLTHEFVDAVVNERRPAVDIYEALAMTVPGIIAHESALRGGETMKIPSFDPAS